MFISLEGCEGTGKTTLSIQLKKKLQYQDYLVLLTKEPGGCENTNFIRNILLNMTFNKLHPYTESLLYAADRTEHLHKIVIPALQTNKIVICDRYLDSSVAYQGYGKKLGSELIYQINFDALNYLPDITFYIDLDPRIGLRRLKKFRKDKMDNFDLADITFHDDVRKGYLQIASENKKRIVVIDGQKSTENILEIIYQKIMSLLRITNK